MRYNQRIDDLRHCQRLNHLGETIRRFLCRSAHVRVGDTAPTGKMKHSAYRQSTSDTSAGSGEGTAKLRQAATPH